MLNNQTRQSFNTATSTEVVLTGFSNKILHELVFLYKINVLLVIYDHYKSRDSSIGIALGYRLDDRDSRVRFFEGLGIFLFTTASRTSLGPTQPPIQRVSGTVSLGIKRPGREADHSPPSTAEVKE
jgi:hypothetical protein